MKKFVGIIPARFASSRFPGKPLADIAGQSMIQRVYRQAQKSMSLAEVIVATDHPDIEEEVKRFGGVVCLTGSHHLTGTDRCAEVLEKMDLRCDAVINIQGDEPFIHPGQIDVLCTCFDDSRTDLATLIKPIVSAEVLFNPNSPKVVVNHEQFAIYFSRHPIPFLRGIEETLWVAKHTFFQHIGIYGYRPDILKKITALSPSGLEKAESLEQLRWLENGLKIKTARTVFESVAIDTPEDLKRVISDFPDMS
jgi:3-deoxy-manno-octulosonate cytidylyltransferase (CMP-KDO synthetase)